MKTLLKILNYPVHFLLTIYKLYCYFRQNEKRHWEFYKNEFDVNQGDIKLINSWCSDMWALLWNLYAKFEVRIHPELDFCWPSDVSKEWENKYIYHNAGVFYFEDRRFFYKTNYMHYYPYDTDFSFVPTNSCSSKYANLIKETIRDNSIYFQNTSVILIGPPQHLSLLNAFFQTFLKTEIIYLNEDQNFDIQSLSRLKLRGKVLIYNTCYLVEPSKLVAMQNASGSCCAACSGYNLNRISTESLRKFKSSLSFQEFSRYIPVDSIIYFHRYSTLTIEKNFLLDILDNKTYLADESLIRYLSYLIITKGRLENLDQTKIDYSAI